jgi:hypothetical protein
MRENAIYFEDRAVAVQEACEGDDRDLARQAVDCEQYMFQGMSLLDVAVNAECNRFVQTKSCTEAIHFRLYGDLSPYDTNLSWLGAFSFFALLALFSSTWIFWLIAVALSGFVFFILDLVPATYPLPRIMFTLPPSSDGWRRRTQRRSIPQGFPHQPSQNAILRNLKSIIQHEIRRDVDQSKFTGKLHIDISSRGIFFIGKRLKKLLNLDDAGAAELTDDQLNELWSPTFGCMEQIKCFLCAPRIIFLLNGIQTIGITVSFSIWFTEMRLNRAIEISPIIKHSWLEILLLAYFAMSLLREATQLLLAVLIHGWINGSRNYLGDMWNVIDISSGVTFLFGFFEHQKCIANENSCFSSDFRLRQVSQSELQAMQLGKEKWSTLPWDIKLEVWSLCYSLCLFFSWWRVLNIFYLSHIGYIFSIFVCMFSDVLNWLVVYAILLIGFSMLFLGATDLQNLIPGFETCTTGLNDSGQSNITQSDTWSISEAWSISDSGRSSCHWSYIFIRPMFQSFGEFSLAEMNNSPSLIFLVLTFFVLNLVLMNLLIAMMSGTYEKRSQLASSTRLFDTYELLLQNSRVSVSAPPPFNILLIVVNLISWFWNFKVSINHIATNVFKMKLKINTKINKREAQKRPPITWNASRAIYRHTQEIKSTHTHTHTHTQAIKRMYPLVTWSQRLEMFLSGDYAFRARNKHSNDHDESHWRNIHFDLRVLSLSVTFRGFNLWCATPAESDGNGTSDQQRQIRRQHIQEEIDVSAQKQLSAFVERARSVILNQAYPKNSLEGKIDLLGFGVNHIQTVQETIRRQVAGKRNDIRKERCVLMYVYVFMQT